jgi:hypothetical protein
LENFSFCPADAAIVANIPLADIGMSPYLLLVDNNRFFILNEVTISVIVYPPFLLQVRCSRDDLLLLFGLFGFISYLY